MGRNIFVSYKYGDTSVADLSAKEEFFGTFINVATKARHYVTELQKLLNAEDHIYKGEKDDESLAEFSDDYIYSKLRDKIFHTTITIVLISKNMKTWDDERDQWMPWEISYSLKEHSRDGRTSKSNAVIAVILPDQNNDYSYYITDNPIYNYRTYKTQFLFDILKKNMFNEKNPIISQCPDGANIYSGDYSYIQSVKWIDFIKNINYYLDKAIEIRDKINNYNITKSVK